MMGQGSSSDEQRKRLEVFNKYKPVFASAPIRLMSRTVSTMRSLGYDDLASAIGDMDWRTVPADDPEDPQLRQDWSCLLREAFEHVGGWLCQLSAHPMGYNLDSLGYPAVTKAWSALWSRQLGIDFTNDGPGPAQVFVYHGGNQALQASLLGIAEAHRDRVGVATPPTMLVPLPSFSCPLDQMALQGMQVHMMRPGADDLDPRPDDLAQVPDGADVDGVYLMPINNPTGRTVPPERMRAFVDAVLDRWPHAAIVLDSVYVRLHPKHRDLLDWFNDDPRYADTVIFVDSLSKTHGVTGLRAGALMTRSPHLVNGILRYAQNVMAGPSNAMQAVMLSLLAPFLTGDEELANTRIRLQLRIGRHLRRRRRLLLRDAFARFDSLLDDQQPVLPDAHGFDWDGGMYADLRLSERCLKVANELDVSPTVAFYLKSGIAGVPLEGFCRNLNLERHGLVTNGDDPALQDFVQRSRRYVRLSFGMTPPPRI